MNRPKRNAIALAMAVAGARAALCQVIAAIESEGGWRWFIPFVLDLPISLIFPLFHGVNPQVLFGVFGSIWWGLVVLYFANRRKAPSSN